MGYLYKCVVYGFIGICVRLGTPSYLFGRNNPCQCKDVSSFISLCTHISAVSPSVKVRVGMGIWPFTAMARFVFFPKVTMVSLTYKSYRTVRSGVLFLMVFMIPKFAFAISISLLSILSIFILPMSIDLSIGLSLSIFISLSLSIFILMSIFFEVSFMGMFISFCFSGTILEDVLFIVFFTSFIPHIGQLPGLTI